MTADFKKTAPMAETETDAELMEMLTRVSIVLKGPKYPENIGAAARSAFNMGISDLLVVGAVAPDREKMLKMATHKAAHIIKRIGYYETLPDALAPFAFVVGTSARRGRHRRSLQDPRDLARILRPLLKHNRVALLFGPEDRGLSNDDLKYCQVVTTIPTAGFSSLNLAQAVAIHCYALFSGLLHSGAVQDFAPRLADAHELEGMFIHLEQMLNRIDFFKNKEGADYWMNTIRHFLGRLRLRAKEVRIVRGFCRQFLWYDEQQRDKIGKDKRC